MGKVISNTKIDDTLTLSNCTDGYWLYDSTRGMNLAMRAKSNEEAYIEAIKYYQNRLIAIEQECKDYRIKLKQVSDIVDIFDDDDE